VIQGSTSVVIQSDGELIDLIHKGQGVLNILPLAGVRDEMDARIRELHPVDEAKSIVTELPASPISNAI
jgi:hypothetical protein